MYLDFVHVPHPLEDCIAGLECDVSVYTDYFSARDVHIDRNNATYVLEYRRMSFVNTAVNIAVVVHDPELRDKVRHDIPAHHVKRPCLNATMRAAKYSVSVKAHAVADILDCKGVRVVLLKKF